MASSGTLEVAVLARHGGQRACVRRSKAPLGSRIDVKALLVFSDSWLAGIEIQTRFPTIFLVGS